MKFRIRETTVREIVLEAEDALAAMRLVQNGYRADNETIKREVEQDWSYNEEWD